jgi:hypothetical protein
MGIFKVYIHGRPQGQDIWPQYETAYDRIYIEPFLDSTIGADVNVSLITDIYQNNSYYTYIHRKNVVEKVARGQAGNSYFALTIRFNGSICRNVNSLYNLLNQVFEKVCVGNIINIENGIKHYLINRFEDKPAVIGQILSIIEQNIDKVLSPSIVSLGSARDTNTLKPIDYSLLDVDSPSFLEDVKKFKLIISPEKESKSDKYASLLKQVQPIKDQCERLTIDLNETRQAKNSLKDSNETLQRNLQTAEDIKRQLEIKLSKVAAQYKQIIETKDGEISRLQDKIETKDGEISRLQKIVGSLPPYENKLKSWLNSILLGLILAISVYSLVNSCNKGNNGNWEKKYIELKERYEQLRGSINSCQKDERRDTIEDNTNNIIDIKEYGGSGPLENRKIYTLTIKDLTWKIESEGANLISDSTFSVSDSTKDIVIFGCVNETKVISRKVP